MSDGDLHNARYLVWKYKGKKAKLWKSLEKKYGAPVLYEDEWPDDDSESGGKSDADEDHEDLDAKEDKSSANSGEDEL